MTEKLLEIEGLAVDYPGRGWRGQPFRAVDGIALDIIPGETLGLVGESGSGKSTVGRSIVGLAPVTAGQVRFGGVDISHLSRSRRRTLAKDIQVVFQDPYTSLNPAMTVGETLAEPLTANGVSKKEASRRIGYLLERVGMPTDAAHRLPREFSGGQRQRVAIARALALDPRLIICDEPVSALDLTTQARVLDLLIEIQRETGVGYLFISHDLSVIRHISHRVAVMYQGRIVEIGDVDRVTLEPEHPYTKRLFMAAPVPDPEAQSRRREERLRIVTSPATEP